MEKQFVLGLMLLSLGFFLGVGLFLCLGLLAGLLRLLLGFRSFSLLLPGPLASLSWTPFARLRSLNLTGLK